ncbi:MAG: hypothetical protein K2P75_01360 [Sphingobacteriaceae bacterium]|jgi:hypothetical protein|nr:hypothetical protein [Sphingobacteriaceae bacterium]
MKKSYSYFYKRIDTLKRLVCLSVVLVVLVFQNINAQSIFKTEPNAVVNLAADSFKNNFSVSENSKYLSAKGNFVFKDGNLDDVKSFTIKTTLSSTARLLPEHFTNDSLGFELTRVMILPYMSLIHIVGNLEIGGVSKTTEMDFSYLVNADQSISLIGIKSIKLNDYKKDSKINAAAFKANNEVNLELNLLFKNNQASFIAAN